MQQIEIYPLGREKYFIVDDADFETVMMHKWYLRPDGYVVRVEGSRRTGQRTIRLHRVINQTPEGLFTDHINGNRLDNRRRNLRSATKLQNNMNTSKKKTNTSGYLGVSWCHRTKKWRARIDMGGRNVTIGNFSTKEEAAYVFNQVAIQVRGEFARLNRL
jgi:hypothetical protein